MEHKLRIIMNCNAPWASSGYGVQTEMITSRIQKEGYPLALVNFYGQEGGLLKINDILMYPKMASQWGEDALVYHGKAFKADISMTLQDVWTLNPDFLKQMQRFIPIVPIDHDPTPNAVVDKLRFAYRIITYSEFGQRTLKKLGFHSTLIPHTVDTSVMKPLNQKEEIRKSLGLPQDDFVFGVVAANKDNPPRKAFQHIIDAFKMFHDTHPKSCIYMHSLLNQQGGFPVEQYWNFLGLPKDKLFFTQPYDLLFNVNREGLAKIYNAFDCYLMPSAHEGFGVTAIEAQACGIPVITNNWTSMSELIIPKKTGFLTEGGWKWFSPMGSYWSFPSISSIHNCMIDAYKADREKVGEDARKFIVEKYDTDMVFREKWIPFLETLEKEVYPT